MAYNTGNPVGSTDPRDLFDNAGIIDQYVNGPQPFYPDRFAVQRLSLAGMRYNYNSAQEGRAVQFAADQALRAMEFNEFLTDSAYVPMGNYSAGLQFDRYNQYLAYGGNFYTPAPGSLPFTTSGTWEGADEDLFVLFNQDIALRQQLGQLSGGGLVGYSGTVGSYVEGTVGAALRALEESVAAGSVGIPGAAGDGVTDDTDAIQAAIDASKGALTFSSDKTYLITRGLSVEKPLIINLNGSTIKGQFDVADPGIWVKSNTVQIGNGSILLVGTIMGVHGGSLNCIYTGNEATGEGFCNLRYHDLTVSTNRNDAGATIGFLGENHNFIVENIKVPDNSQCRNIIGIEWAGTPSGGTGHPHNGLIRNLEIGRLTFPTFGAEGYAYAVWISAAFNIRVENVSMVQGYGLVMATRGDNAGTYAPERYRDRIGSGISVENASISECFGYGLCAIGSHRSSEFRNAAFNVSFRGIKVIGKKMAGNANFGLVVDQTDGVSLEDFAFDGDITAGVTTVATNDNLKITHGRVLSSDVYGISLSNDCRWPRIRDVHFKGNNKPGAEGATLAAIYTGACNNPEIEGCTFGEAGVAETQKYSIFFDSSTIRPKFSNNHTYALGSGGVAYVVGSSTEYGINASGSNNTAETGLVVHGGAPVFNVGGTGLRSFYATAAPTSGTWARGEQVTNSLPAVGSPRGWVCTLSGTPGTWSSLGNL